MVSWCGNGAVVNRKMPKTLENKGDIKKYDTMNYYFSDSKRFADLFNAVFFQGESVVDPDVLSEGAEVYHQPGAEKPKTGRHGERIERIHDVRKKLKTGGVLCVLALENQELVDYAVPFRCMQYDTM